MTPEDRDRLVIEVSARVMGEVGADPKAIEAAIFDTLYEERRRLETEPHSKRTADDKAFYDGVHRRALGASSDIHRQILGEMVQRFAWEVAGYFNRRTYDFATRAVPPALNVLLNTLSPLKVVQGFESFENQVQISGEAETFVALSKKATTILVPTHVSNLDSILAGFSIYRLGLPPYIYGAGLNLFSNPLIGFFMRNLGAYKVDRRKKAPLYKEVLKRYAGCTMEYGYHNLFFPGGTRSRSGGVERRLKLGLLGMGLSAYLNNLRARKDNPDVFVVPCTLNYELVLEAETLIEDHLKEVGKSRYIIEDDEFSRPKEVLTFAQKLFSLSSPIDVVVAQPLDVFGNMVDIEAISRDHRGRPIDRKAYLMRQGEIVDDAQRDHELTRELASSVKAAFHRDTVLNATHVVSRAVFGLLRARNAELDLYRLLRTGGRSDSFLLADVYQRLDQVLVAVRRLADAGLLRLSRGLHGKDAMEIVGDALSHFASYHRQPALERRGDRLFHIDRKLLLYYQNRAASLDAASEIP